MRWLGVADPLSATALSEALLVQLAVAVYPVALDSLAVARTRRCSLFGVVTSNELASTPSSATELVPRITILSAVSLVKRLTTAAAASRLVALLKLIVIVAPMLSCTVITEYLSLIHI